MQNYLAEKYGSKREKKREKKKKQSAGMIIVDEDEDLSLQRTLGPEEPVDDDQPVVVPLQDWTHQIGREEENEAFEKEEEEEEEPRERRRRRDSPEPEDVEPVDLKPKDTTQTVYRDKMGRKVDIEQLKKEQEEREKPKVDPHVSLGMKQLEERKAYKERLEKEKNAPLAVSIDDKELNARLKERVHWGDPMAHLSSRKDKKGDKKRKRVVYQGDFAPNRFNIAPGYRWDGVDRSNGFEAKLLLSQNQRNAKDEAAYKWSTEDM